jgi:hypothetical protein
LERRACFDLNAPQTLPFGRGTSARLRSRPRAAFAAGDARRLSAKREAVDVVGQARADIVAHGLMW